MAAMTEAEMISAALAASLEENAELTSADQLETVFSAPANGGGGVIRQHNLLNQFSSTWAPLIQQHLAPQSICGYLCLAYAVTLSRMAPEERMDLDRVEAALRE